MKITKVKILSIPKEAIETNQTISEILEDKINECLKTTMGVAANDIKIIDSEEAMFVLITFCQ
jgi:hypothetical protein